MKFIRNIPIKISPDRLVDTLVQVFFKSNLDFIVSVGYFHSYFKSLGFEYIKRDDILNQLFVNDLSKVKIVLRPDNLVFNCTEEYIGWTKYSEIIRKVYENISNTGLISDVNRIGLRYVSNLPDRPIEEMLNLKFNSLLFEDKDTFSKISFELRSNDNLKSILNIIVNDKSQNTIDIDVINEGLNISNNEDFVGQLELLHTRQKQIFFTLLEKNYLNELKPVYSHDSN